MKLSIDEEEAFHALMISGQTASEEKLPKSIVHFMEQALSISTKTELIRRVDEKRLEAWQMANAMILAGDGANHGSVERVEEHMRTLQKSYTKSPKGFKNVMISSRLLPLFR